MADIQDVEPLLRVGMLAYLCQRTDKREGARVASVVRGWLRGGYLLLDALPGGERLPSMARDQACTVRFLSDGYACGFESTVVGWEGGGFTQVRIAWPQIVHSMPIRRHERVEVQLPCRLAIPGGKEMEGVLTDLSSKGFGARCEGPRGFIEGETILVSFALPNGCPVVNAVGTIRNLRITPQFTTVGCELTKLAEHEVQDLELFVSGVLESRQPARAGERRILALECDSAAVAELTEGFRAHDYSLRSVRCVVDCLYRLRLSLPAALLISAGLTEMPVGDLCRILRSTRGLERLPVFVYGMSDAPTAERLQKEGLAVVLPSQRSIALVVEALNAASASEAAVV